MKVTRYESADAFLRVALPMLMMSEAENNLLLGVAQGIARNPSAVCDPYLATVGNEAGAVACAAHIAPHKLIITRANPEPIVALASDVFAAIPHLAGVTGPSRSVEDFSLAWSKLSGAAPVPGMRLRIHETRKVVESARNSASGHFRPAAPNDANLLAEWTEVFVSEARIAGRVDARRIVDDAIARGRLYVWADADPVSMAAWAGKTPNGVRIHSVYTPRALRRRGYGTACVRSLTRQQLAQGNAFCWLYTDDSIADAPSIFKRIGYVPVSDVSEYALK